VEEDAEPEEGYRAGKEDNEEKKEDVRGGLRPQRKEVKEKGCLVDTAHQTTRRRGNIIRILF